MKNRFNWSLYVRVCDKYKRFCNFIMYILQDHILFLFSIEYLHIIINKEIIFLFMVI